MGIYRSFIEEEIAHLDDNNNPDEQIEELEDVIDSSDANKAEQDAAQAAEFGPDCGVDDIMDESAMAIYEYASAEAEIMKSIGLQELYESSMGREYLTEGKIGDWFEKAKNAIKEFFKKVGQVLKRWGANLLATFTSNKKLVSDSKYVSLMTAGYKVVKSDSTAKKVKGYPFTDFGGVIAVCKDAKNDKQINSMISDITGEMSGSSMSKEEISGAEGISTEDMQAFDEMLQELINGYQNALTGKASTDSIEDFSKALRIAYFGAEEPDELEWWSVDAVKQILADKKGDIKAVKDMAKGAKKEFNNSIKAINTLEKRAKSVNSKKSTEGSNTVMTLCIKANSTLRKMNSATQTARSIALSAIRHRAGTARKMAMVYIRAANKGKYKGFQKESTEFGFLGNFGLV